MITEVIRLLAILRQEKNNACAWKIPEKATQTWMKIRSKIKKFQVRFRVAKPRMSSFGHFYHKTI